MDEQNSKKKTYTTKDGILGIGILAGIAYISARVGGKAAAKQVLKTIPSLVHHIELPEGYELVRTIIK